MPVRGVDPLSIDAAVERMLAERGAETVPAGFEGIERAAAEEQKRRGLHLALLALPVASHLGNAYTTDMALNLARSRGLEAREANAALRPFSGSDAALYGSRAVTGLLTTLAAEILARKKKRGLGKLVAGAGTAAGLAGMALDLTKGRRDPRRAP